MTDGLSPAARAEVVARLRRLARGSAAAPASTLGVPPGLPPRAPAEGDDGQERCDMCGTTLPPDHRHLLALEDRRILCACEPCVAIRSADAGYRPTGSRSVWLGDFDLTEEAWARFRLPIGLAFFFHSSVADAVIALYPSPAGATESELSLEAWEDLVTANPILSGLEVDAEALIVNRISAPAEFAIVPIDRCYELVGRIKSSWEGISGGDAVANSVATFFAQLRQASGAGA
jgi:hypothetical protein